MKGKAFSGENVALADRETEQPTELSRRCKMIVTSAAAVAGAALLWKQKSLRGRNERKRYKTQVELRLRLGAGPHHRGGR